MTFIERDGTRRDVDAPLGLSVLEIAHQHGVDIEGAFLSMEPLSPGVSLPGIQDYVRRMEQCGPGHQDLSSQCLKLGKEIGKLYGAVLEGSPQDPAGRTAGVGGEAARALILLMSIVNRCGINLEDAFRTKEARNESRIWI